MWQSAFVNNEVVCGLGQRGRRDYFRETQAEQQVPTRNPIDPMNPMGSMPLFSEFLYQDGKVCIFPTVSVGKDRDFQRFHSVNRFRTGVSNVATTSRKYTLLVLGEQSASSRDKECH